MSGGSPVRARPARPEDAAAVGFVTGDTLYDSARAAHCVFLNDLYVAPEARRRGAGCLWWGVDLPDVEASRFYDALGAGDEGGFAGRILVGAAFDALADTAEPG